MKTLILDECLKVLNGETYLFYEGYKFSMKTVYSYGEEKWECTSRNCRSALYLVENRENNQENQKKTHVILTYKSTLTHNHTVDGKRNETVLQKKRKLKLDETNQKQPKIIKNDISSLYPGLVSTKIIEESNLKTKPIHSDFTINQIIGRQDKNWLLSERLNVNRTIPEEKTLRRTSPIRFRGNASNRNDSRGTIEHRNVSRELIECRDDSSSHSQDNSRPILNPTNLQQNIPCYTENITYRNDSLQNIVYRSDPLENIVYRSDPLENIVYRSDPLENNVYRSGSTENIPYRSDSTENIPYYRNENPYNNLTHRLPIKDLYYYNLNPTERFLHQKSFPLNHVCNYYIPMIVPPMNLPLPVEMINLQNHKNCNEPVDLSIIKID